MKMFLLRQQYSSQAMSWHTHTHTSMLPAGVGYWFYSVATLFLRRKAPGLS